MGIEPGQAPVISGFSRTRRAVDLRYNPSIDISTVEWIMTGYSWEKVLTPTETLVKATDGSIKMGYDYTVSWVFSQTVEKRFTERPTNLTGAGKPFTTSSGVTIPATTCAVAALPEADGTYFRTTDFASPGKRWSIVSCVLNYDENTEMYVLTVSLGAMTKPRKAPAYNTQRRYDLPDLADIEEAPDAD